MSVSTKIFDRSNLKGIAPELQDEIIRRFNDYDTLVKVMTLTAANLVDLAKTSKSIDNRDKEDISYLVKRLKDATTKDWLKENVNFY